MPPSRPWTDAEIDALRELFPRLVAEKGPAAGAKATAAALRRRRLSPYLRSRASIERIATAYGLRSSGVGSIDEPHPKALEILELVRDYRGLPLSYEDVRDELAIERKRAQVLLRPLVSTGALEVFEGPNGQILLRAPDPIGAPA
jgi:hypothetical protein